MVPLLASDFGWDVAVQDGGSSLIHHPCPWGGHLVKFSIREVPIEDFDGHIMIRPETWNTHELFSPQSGPSEMIQHDSPGNIVVRQPSSGNMLQLGGLVFGDLDKAARADLSQPVVCRQRYFRAFPTRSDSTVVFSREGGDPSEALLICRREEEKVQEIHVSFVFVVSTDRLKAWLSTHVIVALQRVRKQAEWYFQRPGLVELRSLDSKMYMVLGVRCCKNGPPLLPLAEGSSEPVDAIVETDKRISAKRWTRWQRDTCRPWQLRAFLQKFAARLGLSLETYDSLDGQALPRYQCVVKRAAWEQVQAQVQEAFLWQKRAYRRANGGTTAPSLDVDIQPRYIVDSRMVELGHSRRQAAEMASKQHKVKVRHTFIEVDGGEVESDSGVPAERPARRAKTVPRTIEGSF